MFNCLPNQEKLYLLKIKYQNKVAKYNLIIDNITKSLSHNNHNNNSIFIHNQLNKFCNAYNNKIKYQNNIEHLKDNLK